jgi:hypothetical protein
VNTSEGAGDDGRTTQVPGLERSVLTGRTLTVVPISARNRLVHLADICTTRLLT